MALPSEPQGDGRHLPLSLFDELGQIPVAAGPGDVRMVSLADLGFTAEYVDGQIVLVPLVPSIGEDDEPGWVLTIVEEEVEEDVFVKSAQWAPASGGGGGAVGLAEYSVGGGPGLYEFGSVDPDTDFYAIVDDTSLNFLQTGTYMVFVNTSIVISGENASTGAHTGISLTDLGAFGLGHGFDVNMPNDAQVTGGYSVAFNFVLTVSEANLATNALSFIIGNDGAGSFLESSGRVVVVKIG